MNVEQKQRAAQMLRRFSQANPRTLSADNAAVDMAALLHELIEQPASVPVLTVECEPDYWSGGHYHEGTLPHIDPTDVWKLTIGTKLYTAPPAPSVPDSKTLQFLTDVLTAAGLLRHGKKDVGLATRIADESFRVRQQLFTQPEPPADLVRDAERYRWLRECYWNDSPLCVISKPKSNCLPGAYFPRSSFLDEEIDAAIEREILGGGE